MDHADVAWALPKIAQFWCERAFRPWDLVDRSVLGRFVEFARGWRYREADTYYSSDAERALVESLAPIAATPVGILRVLATRIAADAQSAPVDAEPATYLWFAAEMGVLQELLEWWDTRRDRCILVRLYALRGEVEARNRGKYGPRPYWAPSAHADAAVVATVAPALRQAQQWEDVARSLVRAPAEIALVDG